MSVQALYIDPRGPYPELLGPENCWDIARDARLYNGPGPVVAHPPCGPWGLLRHLYRGAEHNRAPRRNIDCYNVGVRIWLAAKDARISELEGKVASLEARVSELAMTTGDDADGLRSAWAKVQELEDQLALRDREIARLKEDVAGLEYVRGYQTDLVVINKVLDEHNAPHDSEESVSLDITRIRLLAEQRDAALARVKELESTPN